MLHINKWCKYTDVANVSRKFLHVLFKESKLKVANYRVVNQNTVYVLHQGKFGVFFHN